jgi:hypothetical protein
MVTATWSVRARHSKITSNKVFKSDQNLPLVRGQVLFASLTKDLEFKAVDQEKIFQHVDRHFGAGLEVSGSSEEGMGASNHRMSSSKL